MEKEYDPMDFNNAVKCPVCGQIAYMDDYGNMDKCPNCGWMGCSGDEFMEKWHGISYPMLVPLSRAREQYKNGQKFKATFEEFISGLLWYKEMLFWYNGMVYETIAEFNGNISEYKAENCNVIFCNKEMKQKYENVNEFREKANIDGRLLKDIWDEVVHPCFMYCGTEHDYDVPPED